MAPVQSGLGRSLNVLRLLVLRYDVGAASRGNLDGVLAAGCLDGLLAHDDAGARCQRRRHEGRERLVEHDRAAVGVLDLDMVVGDVVALPFAFRHAVVGIGHVLGGDFAEAARST